MSDSLLQLNDNPMGLIPKGWTVGSLADVCDIRNEKAYPQALTDVRYVGLEHIDSSSPMLSRWGSNADVRSAKSYFYPGDILYGKLRPYLQKAALAHFAGICSTDVLVLRANRRALSEWLIFLFHTDDFVRHAISTTAGTNLPRTSWTAIKEVRIPIPPLPEQRRIAHVLSTLQRAIQAQDAVIAAARELKRALMQRLFTYGPYAEPLPTKETDFGEVPLSWPEVGLEHCAKVQTGVAKGRKLDGADTVELPYLRVANVQDGYLDLDEIKTLTILRTEMHRFRLQDRDVLLTEGGDFDKLGRGFIWRNQLDPCIHQNHIFAVRTDRSVLLPEFFSYLVQSVYGKRYFLKVAHRTTNLASINSTKLKALPVLLASMDEQRAVVNMLEQVDFKVAMEERRGAALVALFQSMLHQLMTGQVRVPPTDFGSRRLTTGSTFGPDTGDFRSLDSELTLCHDERRR